MTVPTEVGGAPIGPGPLGDPIHRLCDAQGEVQIHARGRLRLLTLGNQVEQSCIDLDHPARLVHAYTRAMLLGLLLVPAPRSALLLGLGGGALAQALLAADAAIAIEAVESRALVVEAARRYLALPDSGRLQVHVGDAAAFVRRTEASYDLALLDLYEADGVHPDQHGPGFLAACRGRLRHGGLLVANLWSRAYQEFLRANGALQLVFPGRVLYLHVQGGNAVAFAFPDEVPGLRQANFLGAAQVLGLRLGIPLQPLARALWGQNAETLHRARLCPGS